MKQIVIDTNVMVSAARSKRGASYVLLSMLPDGRWEMNVSSALLLEYEARLKSEMLRQGRDIKVVDGFLDYVASIANRRNIFFLLRPVLPDLKDDFILELAVAARAAYIVTYNKKDFGKARDYGIVPVTPGEFLKLLEEAK